ncbi:hypothetical protein CYPRO_2374 [Cyclonatronum proteinivorum]|uniref:Uncharacterized protein n=1 Tax=Cyclonatronum proteinivorum TaxID=1457365 RepID=A0A345UMB4_9BACT|nr:hypothetical protein [Cyclonatronum proteinivorum]AXJ01616.1 hypothetical protein CYPRO_2374 [Cyclonatronum proteinivorum]
MRKYENFTDTLYFKAVPAQAMTGRVYEICLIGDKAQASTHHRIRHHHLHHAWCTKPVSLMTPS